MSQKPKTNRGGKREGAGRKPAGDAKRARHTFTLDNATVSAAKSRTDNLSGLLDSLLRQWLQKPVGNEPDAR
jgi:hypothetical protein